MNLKIGVANELTTADIGGSEHCMAVLAEALQDIHQVEIATHASSLRIQKLAEFTGTNLSGVRLRHVKPEAFGYSGNRWRRYHEARSWQKVLSQPYDLFINFTHGVPPFCHAPMGVLVVLFPFFYYGDWRRGNDGSLDGRSLLWKQLKRLYYGWEWKRRFESYQVKLAISHYTRTWTKRLWGVDCEVLYPPVENDFNTITKENIILSVGRFTAWESMKKQLELVSAFREMEDARLSGWDYRSVGGLSDNSDDKAYFGRVRRLGGECGAQVMANIARPDLKKLYEGAKIFWHAAGYGVDESAYPEQSEHFGITTVEAMAAGCVPVVINKGGQPEIVQHGVNGFLWNTLDELKEYTRLLVRDEQLRARMSEAARGRARLFSRQEHVHRLLKALQPFLS